jgi:hypothetical protein
LVIRKVVGRLENVARLAMAPRDGPALYSYGHQQVWRWWITSEDEPTIANRELIWAREDRRGLLKTPVCA